MMTATNVPLFCGVRQTRDANRVHMHPSTCKMDTVDGRIAVDGLALLRHVFPATLFDAEHAPPIYASRNWAHNAWVAYRSKDEPPVEIPPPNPGEIWLCTVQRRGEHIFVAMPLQFVSYTYPMRWEYRGWKDAENVENNVL